MLVDTGCNHTIVTSSAARKSKVIPKNKVPILCVYWAVGEGAEVIVAPVAVLLGSNVHTMSEKPAIIVNTTTTKTTKPEQHNSNDGLLLVAI